jgi:hypothetical protein
MITPSANYSMKNTLPFSGKPLLLALSLLIGMPAFHANAASHSKPATMGAVEVNDKTPYALFYQDAKNHPRTYGQGVPDFLYGELNLLTKTKPRNFMWFHVSGKSYITWDATIVDQARQLLAESDRIWNRDEDSKKPAVSMRDKTPEEKRQDEEDGKILGRLSATFHAKMPILIQQALAQGVAQPYREPKN